MADDPMITDPEVYSINTFPGDGIQTVWELNFAGGFISRDHIKAYTTTADGTITVASFTWTGPATIEVTPAVAVGTSLTVYRDTPKAGPVVDFSDGSIINEANLDKLAKQSVFTSAEVVDRLGKFAVQAQEALTLAQAAIDIAEATIGGDFTAFARTNVNNTWVAAQNLPTASKVNGIVIATVDYVSTAIAGLATTLSVTSAIATAKSEAITAAATDASTKAALAQSNAITAAAIDATNKANAVAAAIDVDWLYTLAQR